MRRMGAFCAGAQGKLLLIVVMTATLAKRILAAQGSLGRSILPHCYAIFRSIEGCLRVAAECRVPL